MIRPGAAVKSIYLFFSRWKYDNLEAGDATDGEFWSSYAALARAFLNSCTKLMCGFGDRLSVVVNWRSRSCNILCSDSKWQMEERTGRTASSVEHQKVVYASVVRMFHA